MRGLVHLDNLVREFRYAIRNLGSDPRFACVAVFALALGIGAATVAFSAFYNLLFHAFAARDSGRLVVLTVQNADAGSRPDVDRVPLQGSLSDLDTIRSQSHVFEEIIGYSRGLGLLDDGKENHQVYVGHVTGNAFDFYGVAPLLGRGIVEADAQALAQPVFVMSYRMWKGVFNEDRSLLGKSFLLSGEPRTLVGIMPRRFQAFGALQQVWEPITDTRRTASSQDEPSVDTMMARLRPGVSLEAASAELGVVVSRLATSRPAAFPRHFHCAAVWATDFLMGPWGIGSAGGPETEHFDIKHMLYDLLAGVILLLLIACSCVANLLLARGAAREKELAVRSALGASRGRLVRQLLLESSVLAIAAGLLGCLFAHFGMKVVQAAIPQKGASVGGEAVIGIDFAVLFFALGVCALTPLICGLVPALQVVGHDLQSRLSGATRSQGGIRHGKFRGGLVVCEIGLSIVLLSGAGLMVRSFYGLTHIDLGFNTTNLLFVATGLPAGQHTPTEEESDFKKIVEQLKALPGVTELAINNSLPGYNPGGMYEAMVPGSVHSERAGFDGCSESLLRTLQMRMASGRWLSASEVDAARPVAVINQTMATHFFGGQDPLGREIRVKAFDEHVQPRRDALFEVIGVVNDVKDYGPQVPVRPMAFIPYTIKGGGIFFLRTKGDPARLMNAVQKEVWAVNPDYLFAPESGPYIEEFYRLTYSPHELGLTTFTGVAGTALLLVIIGVFSVMAYSVSLRTQEFGIRMALGAQRDDILSMVLRNGSRLIGGGIATGLPASYALTRLLNSQIWGVSPTDPSTFAAVVVLVGGVGLLACYLPARQATRVDPLVALRHE